jgi:hypothetical protein
VSFTLFPFTLVRDSVHRNMPPLITAPINVLLLVHRFRRSVFFTSLPLGYRGYFPGEKRSGRVVEHSIPLSTEVKNRSSYTSNLPICVDKGNFTVLLRNPCPNSHFFCIRYCTNKSQCIYHVALCYVASYTTLCNTSMTVRTHPSLCIQSHKKLCLQC